jgi:opacity protein-like surface antigen
MKVFLLAVLGASVLGASVSLAATNDGWTTYRTERGGFSVEHPPAWTVQERVDAHGALVTTFTPPAGAGIAVVLESDTSSTQDNDDVMNTRCHAVTISGRPAKTCLDTISSSLSTTVVSDGRTYRIMSSRRRGDPTIYDRVLATFRILP